MQRFNRFGLALAAALSMASMASPASAMSSGFWQGIGHDVADTFNSSTHELYVPVHTWHNRATYDPDRIAQYNERPTGAGYGLSRMDADGNWHGVYAMVFLDSHGRPQPILGYNFEWTWWLDGVRVGLGYTANITGRAEYHYVPLPLPLPLASIEYKRLTVQATYIPGTYNNGNVLFTSIRWRL